MEEAEKKPQQKSMLKRLVVGVMIALVIASIIQELRKPAAERSWNGRIVGVPYDYRWPSVGRLREAYWNPDSTVIFTPRALGLGWGVNLPALCRQLLGRD